MSESEAINQAVKTWIMAGDDLSTIQRKLREEFSCSKTFMEVRFLVDDLDLELVDKQAEAAKAAEKAAAEASAANPVDAPVPAEDDAEAAFSEAELVDEGGGSVSVEVDAVMRPGAIVSGSVIFSDGEKMGWQLDQMGQLGLVPGMTADYRPARSDLEAFQRKLQEVLTQQGF